jgi:formate-dependent nitrite reductase membrane component NrfD
MDWDLGSFGLLLLLGMSLGWGLIAQVLAGQQTTRWLWLIVTGVYFVSGLFISEIWFGWATEEELQPNIDGLSFDEVLLGVIPAIATVLIVRHVTRRRRHRPRVAQ